MYTELPIPSIHLPLCICITHVLLPNISISATWVHLPLLQYTAVCVCVSEYRQYRVLHSCSHVAHECALQTAAPIRD